MRKTITFAAALAVLLSLAQTFVWGAHNTVTVAAPSVVYFGRTTWNVSSTATVRNTTGNQQTGQLTLFVFQIQPNGRVMEIQRQDLGTVVAPGNASAPGVPFSLSLHAQGSYVLLADFVSTNVPHTHSGTMSFTIF
jgi:hypothetical protein